MVKITHQKRRQTQEFADFMKRKRELVGLSQADVAKEMGYTSAQFVSNWERARSSPPVKDFKKIARLYKIDSTMILDLFIVGYLNWERLQITEEFTGSR